jgi:hydrogenase/urease accessory protein HupE
VRREARALFAVPPREHRMDYLALGFVPTTHSLHFMGKALARSLNPDVRAWRFALGDTDFF